MNIIVIGNGFDIAHNLPTKYTDFLEFVKVIRYILNTKDTNYTDWGKINPQIKKIIIDNTGNIRYNLFTQEKIWKNLLDNNFWIEYFLQNDMHGKENWIDFESEISDVIQSLYYDMHENENEFLFYVPDWCTSWRAWWYKME